jgi:hypothetical protein
MPHAKLGSRRPKLAIALLIAPLACAQGMSDDEVGGLDTFMTFGGDDADDSSAETSTGEGGSGGTGDEDSSGASTDGAETTGTTDKGESETTDEGESESETTETTETTGDDPDDDWEEPLDCMDIGGDCCPPNPDANASLSGTVWAPNGVIPVSGALVYTSAEPPEPIPDHVYCAECLELTCGEQDFSVTAADGTFEVQAESGDKYLVVQKGQFMRVSMIDVSPGNAMLQAEQTELPDEWDPSEGEYIPKIAIANGAFDRLEDAFGKLGLGETMIEDFEEQLVPGTESFELWDNGKDPLVDGFESQGSFAELVADPARLADYHVIFVPCSNDDYIAVLEDPEVLANIREWVEKGGRWYVADWANEWLAEPFPEYQDFYFLQGVGYDLANYDSKGTVLDAGLLAWLEALPAPLDDINPFNDELHPTLHDLPHVMTVDNWSGVKYPLPEVLVDDGMGNMVDVGHKAWLEGPGGGDIPILDIHPLTITAQYGCGKIQFTSYHAAEFFDYVGLSPQELVLMYTILEIGVCQADLPPPQ